MAELNTTIDLRGTTTKQIWVDDNINYVGLGWDIADAVGVLTITGPAGVIYENTDFNNPDIFPNISRRNQIQINLPLDPQGGYTNPVKGNYTVKLTARNTVTLAEHQVLLTYSYAFDPITITADISSGPYTGTLRSEDTTDYGFYIFSLVREHRIKYPTQLIPVPADIVSTDALVVVTPIYTNEWTIIISTEVEYHEPDGLILLWNGTGTFTECVYGGSIFDMEAAINTMLDNYYEGMACMTTNQEAAQKRLVIVNNAWHLLNQAYMAGDAEECDRLCAIIQDQVQYAGAGTCGGPTSVLVVPAPPYSGGGIMPSYTFTNGITEAGAIVRLGGSLTQATVLSLAAYEFSMLALGGGLSASFVIKNDTGVQVTAASASTQGRVSVISNNVALEYNDLVTPANNRRYNLGSGGLVEAADYTASYSARSLVSKAYVDSLNNWGTQVVQHNATLTGDGTVGSPLAVAVPFPGFTTLLADYGYVEPTHAFADLTSHPTTLAGYGITDAVSQFIQLTDTPASYTGHANKFVKVNASANALEFATSSGFVPDTGGTFTGQVVISTNNDYPLILRQIGTGGTPGLPEGGKNVLAFQDGDGDYTAEIGTDGSGNLYLDTFVAGGVILLNDNLSVTGNIVVSGTVDGVDIALWKAEYDTKSPNWDAAYSWGDHAGLYQPLDADLTSIAALGFTAEAFLKKTAANTWALDTNIYATKDYVDSLALTYVYTPTTTTVVTSDGYTGNNASVQAIDASILQIEEAAGTPGFDVRFEFTEITTFNNLLLYVYYHGGSGHIIQVQFFNNDTLSWDTATTFTDEMAFTLIDYPLPLVTPWINGSNEVTMRLYHPASGNTSHYLEIDYISIRLTPQLGGGGGGGVTDHGGLTGLADDDHPQYALANGSRCTYFIPTGAKLSSVDAGTYGQTSLDDDYLYICIQTGTAGNAIWKKIPLVESP
jgi:hypothetical protein